MTCVQERLLQTLRGGQIQSWTDSDTQAGGGKVWMEKKDEALNESWF